MDEESYIGYIKYKGKLVENGLMDARRQARSLLAFDSALRYFITKQAPYLGNLDFEIPVRIRKGSWEALIPETVAGWAQAGLGLVATAYFTKAAQKMAEKDFSDFGVTDLFKKALESIKWFARISKHMGDAAIREFRNVKFNDDRGLIGIVNKDGEVLFVPRQMLDLYANTNPKILEELVSNVEEDRTLVIGTFKEQTFDEEIVSFEDKAIFCDEDDSLEDDVLFPELAHGDYVVLEGEVTRENKTSNSMGFMYEGHILSAYPEIGSIVRFKPLLFLKCRLYGVVNRIDEKGRPGARRPKLFFSNLEPMEDDHHMDLFD